MNSPTDPKASSAHQFGDITVTPISAFSDNYIWLLEHPESQQLWLIDPGDATPVLEYLSTLSNRSLAGILITHHHRDHIDGINDIQKKYPNIPVFGIQSDRVPQVTVPVVDGEALELAKGLSFRIMSVPGHTRDHIVYFRTDNKHPVLFSGDTLFASGCGRLFEGSPKDMLGSMKKLRELPANTLIFCAHEYTTSNLTFAEAVEPDNTDIAKRVSSVAQMRANKQATIPTQLSLEMSVNPFLRWDKTPVIDKACELAQSENLTEVEVFTEIRQWKDRF